jgi:serine/threonine-protein kinase
MGRVLLAEDPYLPRKVAIKVIDGSRLLAGPDTMVWMRGRFFQEARAIALLQHPRIVTIFDINEDADRAYIVMQYIGGPTLRALRRDRRISRAELIRIIRQAAEGLDYAHSKGVVHRDIKPENVLLDADGSVKIADFGLAKLAAASFSTDAGRVVGTLHYMSPEQLQAKPVTGATDQYALAAMAYEILTGRPVFDAETVGQFGYKIVHEIPVPPHTLVPGLPVATEAVFAQALAKEPADRFPDCLAFSAALEWSLVQQSEMPTQVFRPADSVSDPRRVEPVPPPPPRAQLYSLPEPDSGRRFVIVLSALALSACLFLILFWPARKAENQVLRQPVPVPVPTPVPVIPPSPSPTPKPTPAPSPTPKPKPVPQPTPTPVVPSVPTVGTLAWTGELDYGAQLDMGGGAAAGVTGALPGIPVQIDDVHPSSVHIVTAPGPENGWRRLVLRNDGAKQAMVVVRWSTRK